jgi:hypothetical protein
MMHVPERLARRGGPLVTGLTAAAAALGLAACGTQIVNTSGTAAQTSATHASAAAAPHVPPGFIPGGPIVRAGGHAALCAAAAAVTRLVAAPAGELPGTRHPHPGVMPGGVTIASAARARAVARALCALPAMPRGVVNCPNDTGAGYRLSFATARLAFPAVTVGTSGCTVVTGIGAVRTAAHTPRFWAVLHSALGAHPSTGPVLP